MFPRLHQKIPPMTINNYMETKKCKLCEENKSLNEFYSHKGYYKSRCKKCENIDPKTKEKAKRWREKNKEIINAKNRERYHKDIEASRAKCRERYYKDIEASRAKSRKRDYKTEKRKLYDREKYHRMKNNIEYRIRRTLRKRILKAVKSKFKKTSSIELLGCSVDECRTYIESKFQEGMTWENHGVKGWHIDHIIPCSAFDLTKEEEQKKCFHYTNLQPLWWEDNLKKGNKVEDGTTRPPL